MTEKTLINDLTTGPVTKQLLRFSVPFMLSNLLQTLYNMVDMIIVGNFVGSSGLSAVSCGGDLMHLGMLLCMGFTMAGQVIIAQYVGAGDKNATARFIGTIFTFTAAAAVVATLLGLFLNDWLLNVINVPPEAYGEAKSYSLCCFVGMIFIFGYNLVSSILRGMGDSKHPFIFISIAAVMNLLLDLVFVAGFGWRSFGAALATVAGQAFSFIVSLVFLYKRRDEFGFDFKPRSFIPNRGDLIKLVKLGFPMALQSAALNISMLFVSSYINAYGVIASAVNGIGNKLGQAAAVVTGGLSTACSSMIGQCFGAGKKDRVSKCMYVSFAIGLIYSIVLSVILILWPEQIFGLFDRDPEVLAMGRSYVIIAVLNFIGFALRGPTNAIINGLGNATLAGLMGILDGVVCRIGLAMLMGIVMDMGIYGFWYGNVLAGYVPFIIGGFYFWSGLWKKAKPLSE